MSAATTRTKRKTKRPVAERGIEQMSLFSLLETALVTPPPSPPIQPTPTEATLSRHTAAPQLGGYLFQIQRALMRLFDLAEGQTLGIEIIDDLHITQDGTLVEAGQVKLHTGATVPALSDGSADLWKTLGIWARAIASGEIPLDPLRQLVLITNAPVAPDSIGAMIIAGASAEDVVAALLAIRRPRGATLAADFEAVHNLASDKRLAMVDRLRILADVPDLANSTEALRRKLARLGFHEQSLDKAVEEFCGWMWRKVTDRLTSGGGALITEAEFQSAWRDIRDHLPGAALPARFAGVMPDEAALVGQADAIYVRQLGLVNASDAARLRSMQNYFRAGNERNTWVAQGEILPDRLTAYDRELVERWRPKFDNMRDDLAGSADIDALQRAGLAHFREIEDLAIPIQDGWYHRYLTSGTFHLLANALQVGWHPQYVARLQGAASPGGGTGG
jgi:hypothetical protein